MRRTAPGHAFIGARLAVMPAGTRFDTRISMRGSLIVACVIGAAGLCGCAQQKGEVVRVIPQYHDQSAAMLAFTPAIAKDEPVVFLARDTRQPSVFIGFDELSATAYYIRTDDRQSDDYSDRYHRRAVIEKIGVSYR